MKKYADCVRLADIIKTLNHIVNDLSLDCGSCSLKPVCDQVEGMRELHFKKGSM